MVAPHLPEFAQSWCQALHEIRDNEEKDSAYRGFCTLVQTNPVGMAKVRKRASFYLGGFDAHIYTESVVVLQCNRALESAFG